MQWQSIWILRQTMFWHPSSPGTHPANLFMFPVSPHPLNFGGDNFITNILGAAPRIGRTPKGAYSTRGRSRHLLETPFSEPLLRTLLRTLFYCKTHSRPPSQNPSENPFPRTLSRTFSEPFSERCVAVRPLRARTLQKTL